jgi:hypothetical protein
VIHELGKQFNIVTNIRRADVTATALRSWLDGEPPEIERGLRQRPGGAST